MGWLRHYIRSFRQKNPNNCDDGLMVDCMYRLNYNDGYILCYYMGVRSIESCKDCEYKKRR